MPRTDPITGCQVMTQAEFWVSEAKHEGKGREPWELQSEMFQEMADDEERTRQKMLEDTEGAYRDLIRYWNDIREDQVSAMKEWGTPVPVQLMLDKTDEFGWYKPRRVIEIVHADYSGGFNQTSGRVVMRVLFSGGRIRLVSHDYWSSSGSFYEPPDGEDNVMVLPDNWTPEDDEE